MNILAIDLGKFNSMCCVFDTGTQEYSFWQAPHHAPVHDDLAEKSSD